MSLFKNYGSTKVVQARSGLTDNDPGSKDLIKYALVNANSIIYTIAKSKGVCVVLPECDQILDEVANLLALSSLELDREYFTDDTSNIKDTKYYNKAIKLLDMYLINLQTNMCEFNGVYTDDGNKYRKCFNSTNINNDWWNYGN